MSDPSLARINSFMPEQIRVLAGMGVTRGFHARKECSGRTYQYVLPTCTLESLDEFRTRYGNPLLDVKSKIGEVASCLRRRMRVGHVFMHGLAWLGLDR